MTARNEQADTLLAQVLRLPRTYEQTVPADYMDNNGHMNVMYYTAVGNMAMGRFLGNAGLQHELFQTGRRGMFALRQIISYLSEIREGEEVAVHTGLVGHDAKRLHFIHYVVNLTHGRIASTDERMAMYIDMTVRRSTNFEPQIIAHLQECLARFKEFGWTPELSGAIQLKPLD